MNMIESLMVYMQAIILQYGAWGVFVATVIEEIIAPIPSPIVSLAAGFFVLPASGTLAEVMLRALLFIALPVAIGISLGSAVVYALGYYGGKPLIEKTRKFTGIDWQDFKKTEARITEGNKDEIALFGLRLLPIIPGVAISGFCGVVRYPFKKFIIITSVGSFIRAFLLGILGWQVGELYATYADMVSKFEKYILLGVVILAVIFLVKYYLGRKNKVTPSA